MASLIRKSGEDPGDVIELKPGLNRFGTGKNCDFIVDHSSVSENHCDLVLNEKGLTVRDLGSANGTLVNNQPVTEARLRVGQTLQLGELRLLVADDQIQPRQNTDTTSTPQVTYCKQHPDTEVSFHCPHCGIFMCLHCVHVLKVHRGHGLCLCPQCSRPCESLLAKDTRELGQMIDELVMVRNAFAPRPHREHPPHPSDSV